MKIKKIMLLTTWLITLSVLITDALKLTVIGWIIETQIKFTLFGFITFIISAIINISIGNYLYEEINKY